MDAEQPSLHSRRTLSLTFNLPIARTHQFWDSLKEGKFVTTKCRKCGEVTFPPQSDCPACMSNDFEWVDLGTEAELVTYTYVQVTPTSFVANDPYLVAIGRLKEGIKVLAWVEGSKLDDLKPGMRLKLQARRSPEGSPYYVFVAA